MHSVRRVVVRGFSLTELVVVTIIIGIIAAIAAPRVSGAAEGAAAAAVQADLAVLRRALEHYAAEHGGRYPSESSTDVFAAQLTTFTDYEGNTSDMKTGPYVYGPYISKIPSLKAGNGPTSGKDSFEIGPIEDASVGWIYDDETGSIRPNSGTAVDTQDKLIAQY
jgi:prepilin-type N-terminal cleavage/methylation domain-containing protein